VQGGAAPATTERRRSSGDHHGAPTDKFFTTVVLVGVEHVAGVAACHRLPISTLERELYGAHLLEVVIVLGC
jgi:hypothetical protein